MIHYSMREIEKLDRVAVERGLLVRQMMELAGFHMTGVFDAERVARESAVAIVCGKGNKGGDGLSAARHLANRGWTNLSVVLAERELRPDAAHHLALVREMGMPIFVYEGQEAEARGAVAGADVVIDALIGYHIDGAPRGAFAELIRVVNEKAARVIAYDLPSGADPDTGECAGVCVRAEATLTLAAPKKLFERPAGKALSGRVYVADIGIPAAFYDAVIPGSRPDFPSGGLAAPGAGERE